MCDSCNLDISRLSVEERFEHVNKCCDEGKTEILEHEMFVKLINIYIYIYNKCSRFK